MSSDDLEKVSNMAEIINQNSLLANPELIQKILSMSSNI
jgi:hypothetical protein